MESNLRPLTLGEILDRTVQLYRTRFLLFLGISLIPIGIEVVLACGIALVVAWWTAAGASSVSAATGIALAVVFAIVVTLVALPIFLAATALAAAAMNHAVSCIHLGETTTIRDAYKAVWRRGWRYSWLYLLQILIIGAAPAAVWMVLAILGGVGAAMAAKYGIAGGALFGLAALLVFAALAGYVLWMLLRLSLACPACVIEQIGAWPALKRSSALTQGTKGRIFLLYLLVGVLGMLLSMGVTIPLTIILFLIPGRRNPQHSQTAGVVMLFIIYGASFAVQALVKPVYGIALALFYYDQRIRLEGFDIEWMMLQAGMTPATQPEATPWPRNEQTPSLPAASEASVNPDPQADAASSAGELQ